MGSKSKSKNKSTSTNASQMAALQRANPATTMAEAQGNQQALQSGLMEQVAPFFGAMMQMGQQQMDSNPMLKAFGPVSDGERSTLQDMIAALTPQQQPQEQAQVPPVSPFMRGQHIVDQGMANGGQTPPAQLGGSFFEKYLDANPYAGNPYLGVRGNQ